LTDLEGVVAVAPLFCVTGSWIPENEGRADIEEGREGDYGKERRRGVDGERQGYVPRTE
jgi:hypothetical protein